MCQYVGLRSRSPRGLRPRRAELRLVGPHPPGELGVRGGPHDPVELGAIVRDEADALHEHVVGEPAIAAADETVVDGNLGPLFRDELRPDGRGLALDRLACVDDWLPAVL